MRLEVVIHEASQSRIYHYIHIKKKVKYAGTIPIKKRPHHRDHAYFATFSSLQLEIARAHCFVSVVLLVKFQTIEPVFNLPRVVVDGIFVAGIGNMKVGSNVGFKTRTT